MKASARDLLSHECLKHSWERKPTQFCSESEKKIIQRIIGQKLNLQSKQVKRSCHEWINNFIIANLISGIISIFIIWLLDE